MNNLSEATELSSTLVYRLGLAAAGALFLYLASNVGGAVSPAGARYWVPAMLLLGSIGLALLVSAGWRQPPQVLRWLILGGCTLQVLVSAALWMQWSRSADPNLVDSGAYTDFAASILRSGGNPYTWDYSGVFNIRRSQQSNSTPLLNGASESPYPYPALPFLLAASLQALGLPGVFSLSILAHLGLLITAWLAAPRAWQPVVLLPILAGYDFGFLTVIGNLDILWTLAVLSAALAWRRPALCALFFGLALSLKQTPALLMPFVLVRLWQDEAQGGSIRNLLRFGLICAVTFLLVNGPFILIDADAWLKGYTEPVRDSLVIISHGGLSTLTQSGLVHLPRPFFLAAALSVLTLLLFVYWRHYDQLRESFWLMPGIAMWFSFRALVSYWLYWTLPMLLVTIRRRADGMPARARSWKPTLAAAALVVVGLTVAAAALASLSSPVQIELHPPLYSFEGAVNRMVVDVANRSDLPLAPRFSVQSRRTTTNPLPWYIEAGPDALAPGQSATYTIHSSRSDRVFYAPEPVQLVVTDAWGDYSLRGVLNISADQSFLWPERISNPGYQLWDSEPDLPFAWGLSPEGSVAPGFSQGRFGLRLTAGPAAGKPREVWLSTQAMFPEGPLGIWLSPPALRLGASYGLELLDGEHRLRILFGPQPDRTQPGDYFALIHRYTPSGSWQYREVDLRAIYADLGWSIPEPRRQIFRGLNLPLQLIELRLLLGHSNLQPVEAYFGPIIQDSGIRPPEHFMQATLADPARYYTRLAGYYEQDGHLVRALGAYRSALEYAPRSTEVLAAIERIEQQLAGEAP